MSVGVRRALTTATAVASCAAAAVLCASPAWAAHSGGGGQNGCDFGALIYTPNGEPPVVTTTNATALGSGRLTNLGSYNVTGVHAVLSVAPPGGSSTPGGSGAPELSWRVDGGSWQSVRLTWNGLSGPGSAWHSANLDLGLDLGAHGNASVDLETEFTSTSPGGQYVDQLTFTADSCGSKTLGAGLNFADYQPAAGPAASPTASKKQSAPATRPSTAASSAAPKSSPAVSKAAAKPSASPSELQISFVQVLPSAQAVASSQSGDKGLPDGVLAVVAVVFLGGLVCIRAVRRHKSS